MSALKMGATVLWTKLLEAMRADGLIAQSITQTGPATTAVIVELVQQANNGPWLPMSYKPTPGREVVAIDERGCIAAPVCYDDVADKWLWNGSEVAESRFKLWTFVQLPVNDEAVELPV